MSDIISNDWSHIAVLTSLRFFAAFSIFLLHARDHSFIPPYFLADWDLSSSVSFFFVLSGFVLSYAYDNKSINLFRFLKARFARLYPAFLSSLLLVLCILPSSLYLSGNGGFFFSRGITLIISILSIQAWVPIPSVFFSFNAVTWSISCEAFFYYSFTILHRYSLKHLFVALIFSCFLSLSLAWLSFQSGLPGFSPNALNSIVLEGLLYINPLARLSEFIAGVVACKLFLRIRCCNPFTTLTLIYLPKRTLLVSLSSSISILCFWFLGFHCIDFGDYGNFYIPLNQMLSAFNFGALILGASFCQGPLVQFASRPLFIFLGKISYGVYLYHQPLMIRFSQLGGVEFVGIQIFPSNFTIILLLTLFISTLSYFCLEEPFVRLMRRARLPC